MSPPDDRGGRPRQETPPDDRPGQGNDLPPILIPAVTADMATIKAGLAYAAAGLYIGPAQYSTKNPGSVLGNDWHLYTSRDPQMIVTWFAGTNHGIFLHAGRSGVVIFDVDTPDRLHPALAQAIEQYQPPWQSTRPGQPRRGHYLFQVPPGRTLSNSLGQLAGGWGEIRGRNGVVIVAPSVHEEADGAYTWQRTGLIPVLPGYVATLLPDAMEAADSATDAQVGAFLGEHCTSARPELLDVQLTAYARKVRDGESRHGSLAGHLAGAMKEAAAGLVNATEAAARFEKAFIDAVAAPAAGPKQGSPRTGVIARNEWRGLLSWAVAQAIAADPEETRARSNGRVPPRFTEQPAAASDRLAALGELLTSLRTWQHLPDPVHIIVALAAAATRKGDGEPCWVLLVAPPSSGKTEAVRLLDDVADAKLSDVTSAGLLGWSKGRPPRPTGVLTRIPSKGMVTFGDLSSLLATSDRGGRDLVFGHLRDAYDGHVYRGVQPAGGGTDEGLEWSGRLTVVACSTKAIDRYSAHAQALGPRWMYVHIAERTTEAKRKAARLARGGDLNANRKAAREAVANLLAAVPSELPALPKDVADEIENAALVTAWGRAAVPRNGYGKREIEDIPDTEEPMRLIRQLTGIARGVLALGLPDEAAAAIARRVALDTMPAARRAVLEILATGEVLSGAGIGRAAGINRKVAWFALEELAAIGVVDRDPPDEDTYDQQGQTVHWTLKGDDGELIARVFEAFNNSSRGWYETWVYTTPPPQEGEEQDEDYGGIPHTSYQPEEPIETRSRTVPRLTIVRTDSAGLTDSAELSA